MSKERLGIEKKQKVYVIDRVFPSFEQKEFSKEWNKNKEKHGEKSEEEGNCSRARHNKLQTMKRHHNLGKRGKALETLVQKR